MSDLEDPNITDKLLQLCQFSDNDEGFNVVYSSLVCLIPSLAKTDLFLKSKLHKLSTLSHRINKGLVHALLSLHYKRCILPPKV